MKPATEIDSLNARCLEYFRCGAKPSEKWRCGIEVEVFGYDAARNFARLNATQVQNVLRQLAVMSSAKNFIHEGETLIETSDESCNRVTIEPGGQIEFSDAPHAKLFEVEKVLQTRFALLHEIAARENLTFLAVGFDPLRTLAEQHWFPKQRYAIMRPLLAAKGARAHDMMTRTCAAQVNLDYGETEDLAKKFLVGNRLAPIVTAIFANSPFCDGKISGYKSTRSAVWLATDNARSLIAPLALRSSMSQVPSSKSLDCGLAAHCGLEDFDSGLGTWDLGLFVDYTFDVPMFFVQRDGESVALPDDLTFGDFVACSSESAAQHFEDWKLHLTTIFTDARLKNYVELRSADCNDLTMTLALVALWKGLLYDRDALDEALRLAPNLARGAYIELRECVAREALAARGAGVDVLSLAKQIIELAGAGLKRIAPDETKYLDILRAQVCDDEICPAGVLLRNFQGSWHNSMEKVFEYLRVA